MSLSDNLISQFVKMTNDGAKKTKEKTTSYATVVEYEGDMYVKIDGSDLLTPVETTSTLHEDDRVLVDIGGHTATVSGNISSPSVSGVEVKRTEDALRLEFEESIKELALVFQDGYEQGITSISADGIQVSHTKYEGHTRMTGEGFYVNDGKKDVLSCTKDGITYTGNITSSAIEGGTIDIADKFSVDKDGVLKTDSAIIAQGGLYTYQDIRGMDDTEVTGGLTLVTGVGNLSIRTEVNKEEKDKTKQFSIYLQPANGEVKVTEPSEPDKFANLRAYDLLANHAVYADGVNVSSDINRKRDIELYEVDALNEICTTPVYSYHLDSDLDAELKRIGIIMQEAPLDAIDLRGKGVDLYQMVAMLWKAVQQLNEKIE